MGVRSMKKKKILLAVSGGIAVYKAVALVSKLVQANFDVKVMMTSSAQQFVTPLSFQAMSRNDVYVDTFDEKDSAKIAHIDLADWADLILVAPATANLIAKMAHGIADDMISTTLLAATAPVWVAPAMNVHMYEHPAVVRNMKQLKQDGVTFIEPGEGYLACGYVGKGRLEEPEVIASRIASYFSTQQPQPLKGKRVLVTAGPTLERIDPVRFISNFSSGKMGFAMAKAAYELGAEEVLLVAGPVHQETPPGVTRINVESAQEMYEMVMKHLPQMDMIIKSAAVADYKPKEAATQKMKKQPGDASIALERTMDILQAVGQEKKHQIVIGFAAETNDAVHYGKGKLTKKNADFIVVNDVTDPEGGFGSDTNVVTLVGKNNYEQAFPAMQKDELAKVILTEIAKKVSDDN